MHGHAHAVCAHPVPDEERGHWISLTWSKGGCDPPDVDAGYELRSSARAAGPLHCKAPILPLGLLSCNFYFV